MIQEVKQTNYFLNAYKRLHTNQKKEIEKAIISLMNNPLSGEEKKGDLKGIFVYKIKINTDKFLLAYSFTETTIYLLGLGFHENFYKDLKKNIN